MDTLYILLGGKTVKAPDSMTPMMSVAFGEHESGGSGCVSCSAPDFQANAPLAQLTDQAREAMWRTEGSLVLKRYDPATSRGDLLRLDPKELAQADLMRLGRPNTTAQNEKDDVLILRDLQRVARQIVSRKTAFVFPARWPPNIVGPAAHLVAAMVKEVCAYFRDAPIEEELPWTFLAMNADPSGEDPLGDFIRSLHAEILARPTDVKIADWRRKGGAILLSGPTGSGKSYAARLLAADIKHGARPVEVNLAAISGELLESRLRGYEPGTFTGADKKGRKGWFEEAHGGVLFLDEFQSVPAAGQVQLLDVLSAVSDDVYIARVGADHKRSQYNVKVILAINEDIDTLLQEKRLRKDLYYRIRFIQTFPLLKERLGPDRDPDHRYLRGLLASYRWKSLRNIEELCRLDDGLRGMGRSFFPVWQQDAISTLAGEEWDGNFRELERVAFDLFDWYDHFLEQDYYPANRQSDDDLRKPKQIGTLQVNNVLKPWRALALGESLKDSVDGVTARKREKLESIQDALRESGFIIAKVLKSQPYFRSRPTLRTYLRDHRDQLAADVRGDSRMIRFLGV
jgi:transcriptional regulator with AAA-type ATPase domain